MSLNHITILDLDSIIVSMLSMEFRRKSLEKPTSSSREQSIVSEGSKGKRNENDGIQAMVTFRQRGTSSVITVTRLVT